MALFPKKKTNIEDLAERQAQAALSHGQSSLAEMKAAASYTKAVEEAHYAHVRYGAVYPTTTPTGTSPAYYTTYYDPAFAPTTASVNTSTVPQGLTNRVLIDDETGRLYIRVSDNSLWSVSDRMYVPNSMHPEYFSKLRTLGTMDELLTGIATKCKAEYA